MQLRGGHLIPGYARWQTCLEKHEALDACFAQGNGVDLYP